MREAWPDVYFYRKKEKSFVSKKKGTLGGGAGSSLEQPIKTRAPNAQGSVFCYRGLKGKERTEGRGEIKSHGNTGELPSRPKILRVSAHGGRSDKNEIQTEGLLWESWGKVLKKVNESNQFELYSPISSLQLYGQCTRATRERNPSATQWKEGKQGGLSMVQDLYSILELIEFWGRTVGTEGPVSPTWQRKQTSITFGDFPFMEHLSLPGFLV